MNISSVQTSNIAVDNSMRTRAYGNWAYAATIGWIVHCIVDIDMQTHIGTTGITKLWQ